MSEGQGGVDGGAPGGAAPGEARVGSGAGAGNRNFLASLPDNLRSDGTLQNFSGPDGHVKLAQSFTEARRALSTRRMVDMEAPGDDEGRRAVLTKLGHAAPEKPEGYTLPDDPNAKQFRELAHKTGLTDQQAKGMYDDIAARNAQATEERKQRIEARATEFTGKMKQEWGADYDAKMELAKSGFEHFLPEQERKVFEASGIIQNPAVVKMFSELGKALKEGTMFSGSDGGTGVPATVDGFKAERVKVEKEMAEFQKQSGGKFDPNNTAYRDMAQRRKEIQDKEAQAFLASEAARSA